MLGSTNSLYISTNGGANWNSVSATGTSPSAYAAGGSEWKGVAMSSDGKDIFFTYQYCILEYCIFTNSSSHNCRYKNGRCQ